MEETNDILQDAKQGNPKAIEAIFSYQLKAENIAVKVVVRDGCLQIILEAKQALSQVTMVNGVKKVLTGIKPENIQTVKVYSKQLGDDFPKWHEEFELAEKKKVDVSPNIDSVKPEAPKVSETINPSSDSYESLSQARNRATKSSKLIDTNAKHHVNNLTSNLTSPNIADEDSLLMERARWGYLDSISTLLNSAFSSQGVSVSLNKSRAKFLEIILKPNGITDKQIAIDIICQSLNKTKTRVFSEVSISVDTSESDFPSWTQDLIFQDNQFIEKEDVVVDSSDSKSSLSAKSEPSQNKDATKLNLFRPAYSYLISTLLIMFAIPSCQSADIDTAKRALLMFWSGTILGVCTRLYEVGDNMVKEEKLLNSKVAKIIQKLKADDPSLNPIKKGDYGQSNDFSFAINNVSYANSVTGNMFGFPKKIEITGKAAIVELAVWNHRNFNSLLNFRSFSLVDDKLNRYSNHGNSGAVSEYKGGISNTTDLRPSNIFKFYVVFDINPDSYGVFLETAEGSSLGGCLTFSLASETINPTSDSNESSSQAEK